MNRGFDKSNPTEIEMDLDMEKEDYGDSHQDHFLEQYKLYVEMVDRISQRRALANSFFIAANTLLITIITVFQPAEGVNPLTKLTLGIFGGILCAVWLMTVKSYQQLNSGKSKVIHDMESELPFPMYQREWNYLGKGENAEKYRQLTKVEQYVPYLFVLPYVIVTLYGIVSLVVSFMNASSQTAYL